MLIYFFTIYSHFTKFINVGVENWKKSDGKITFISYFSDLGLENIKNNKFESKFWGDLPAKLKDERIETNWLHLNVEKNVLGHPRNAKNFLNKINLESSLQKHVTLLSFLSLAVVMSTLKDWSVVRDRAKHLEASLKANKKLRIYWPFFSQDWKDSMFGETAIRNLLYFNLFEKAFNLLRLQRKGIYLQENQGWEFALIQAWKKSGHNCLLGFPHATVPYWDLRYFFDTRFHKKNSEYRLPRPNKIVISGPITLNTFVEAGYLKADFVTAEALRYSYLEKVPVVRKKKFFARTMKLLVVGDYLESNTLKQLKVLRESLPLISGKMELVFKPHPGCPIMMGELLKMFARVETNQLKQVIEEYQVVYASSTTSAAIDAYCSGIPVVALIDGTQLNLSPLRGLKGVKFVINGKQLGVFLNKAYASKNLNKRKKYFFINKQLPKWKKLIVNNYDEKKYK